MNTVKKVVWEQPSKNLMAVKVEKLVQKGVAIPEIIMTALETMRVQSRPMWSAAYPKKRVPTMPPQKNTDWVNAGFQASSQTQFI